MNTLCEKILKPINQSFTLFRESGEWINCTYHTHPEFELTYVESGNGSLFVNSEILTFRPGMLTLFGSGLPHHYVNRSPGAEVFGIQFSKTFAGPFFLGLPELAPICKMLDQSVGGLIFPAETAAHCEALLRQLLDESLSPMRKFVIFLQILTLLSESEWTCVDPAAASLPPHEADPRIVKAIELIQNNVVRNIPFSLEEIARAAKFKEDAFSRYFSRVTGKSYMEYVTLLKIARASEKLRNTDLSISEICFDCGFRNLSNFNRIFLKRKGVSPSQFRRKYAKLG